MLTLCLDSSGDRALVAIADSDRIIAESRFVLGPHAVARVPAATECVLRSIGLAARELGRIAIVNGPGAWSSLRTGVAFAKSLAYAIDIPIVGVSTFYVLAENFRDPTRPLTILIQSRAGRFLASTRTTSDGSVHWTHAEEVVGTEVLGRIPIRSAVIVRAPSDVELPTSSVRDGLSVLPPSTAECTPSAILAIAGPQFTRYSRDNGMWLAPDYMQPFHVRERTRDSTSRSSHRC